MRFKVDENLLIEVVDVLVAAGHDAVSVHDQGLVGATDSSLYEVCRREGRALMTLDVDFANIFAYPPQASNGIVVFRLSRQSRPLILAILSRTLPLMESEPLDQRLWVIEETRVRIWGK